MTTYNFVLNSTNVVGTSNSSFLYKFPNGSLKVPSGSQMGISQITLPYSFFNVTQALGNNTFSYSIQNSSNAYVLYSITLANGFYTINDVNNALQSAMKSNGHYFYNNGANAQQIPFTATQSGTNLTLTAAQSVQLVVGSSIQGYGVVSGTTILSQTSAYVYVVSQSATIAVATPMNASVGSQIAPSIIYPLSLASYPLQYTNALTSITMPLAASIQSILGQNYFYANGQDSQATWAGGYPTNGNACAYITIPTTSSTTNTIGNLLGFTTGQYPATTTSLTALSQTTLGNSLSAVPPFPPLGSTINGIVVRCNMVNNNAAMPSDILDSFSPALGTTFGSNIIYLPISDNWIDMKEGSFQNLTITFVDQNFNTIQMNDPNILMTLLVRFPSPDQSVFINESYGTAGHVNYGRLYP